MTVYGRPIAAGSVTNTGVASADQGLASQASATSTLTVSATVVTPVPSPQVVSVVRLGQGNQPTRLYIGFDSDLAIATATNLANYRLVSAGRDGVLGTADDRQIPLRAASYDFASRLVTLFPIRPYAFGLLTRLTVSGSEPFGIRDTSGTLLDGNADGLPGGDFVADVQGNYPVAINPLFVDEALAGGSGSVAAGPERHLGRIKAGVDVHKIDSVPARGGPDSRSSRR